MRGKKGETTQTKEKVSRAEATYRKRFANETGQSGKTGSCRYIFLFGA